MIELRNKKIIIATHVYATGPAQDLRDFLINNKTSQLLFIGHPLFFDKRLKGSGYDFYEKGKLVRSSYGKIKKIPSILSYIKDIFFDIYWVAKRRKKWDIFIGFDNLNAFSGIVLRRLGLVKKVVYYVIDYNPKRFKNGMLNKIYHWIDQLAARHANETWNLSPRMEEGRKKYFDFHEGNQKTVPIGIWFSRFKQLDFSEIEKHTLVFMGHILEKQGIQHVLNAIPLVVEKIPDFKFLIIGGGDYLEKLKKQAKEAHIEKFVEFTGYIEKHEDIERMLSESAAAIAMYEKYDKFGGLSFSYFADPGKIKSYLAAGLPVLLSDVSYNAKEIEEKKCGFIINYDKKSIADTIIKILQNETMLEKYRKNAVDYAKEFDWNLIFEKNLKNLI